MWWIMQLHVIEFCNAIKRAESGFLCAPPTKRVAGENGSSSFQELL